MNLSVLDWLIVFICFAGMVYSVRSTKGLMKSVSDFLAAGRTAGRYVVSISSGKIGRLNPCQSKFSRFGDVRPGASHSITCSG